MSKIEVNAIEPQCGTTLTVGAAGTTVTVPSNVVKSNALQASDAGNIISQSGTTITLGATGDTINLASGASQSGFGREGSVNWITTPKTSTFTAVSGEGYFVNTTGGVVTVNLPAGSAGAIVAVNDYGNNSSSNNITINSNGSEKIQGSTLDRIINTNGVTVTLVYVDGTQGWKVVDSGEVSNLPQVALFTTATGGNSCGTNSNFKFHIFTSPGTFCVSQVGNSASNPAGGPAVVDYLVLAGGGGGGNFQAGGGGAGGFRESHSTPVSGSYTASPLATSTGITLPAAGPFAVTVGAGGGSAGAGSVSTFSTITSAGGGNGQTGVSASGGGSPGGSGGGGQNGSGSGNVFPGGSGNPPPVSPPQGQPGGSGTASPAPSIKGNSGGGGGALTAGGNGTPAPTGGGSGMPGGNGAATDISDGLITRAGGGGGGAFGCGGNPGGTGGSGGGGAGGRSNPAPFAGVAGTVNTGGGGGGAGRDGSGASTNGAAGGSGIVVIRYRFQ